MIPVLVGAVVGLAGAALLSKDKSKQSLEMERREVSEDYVAKQLARAGKNISKNEKSGNQRR